MPHRPSNSYHGLPLPRTVRNLLANPGGFLAAVFGLVFLLGVKVFLVRNRPPDGEVDR